MPDTPNSSKAKQRILEGIFISVVAGVCVWLLTEKGGPLLGQHQQPSPTIEEKRQRAESERRGFWVDPNTGLMWTYHDNGSEMAWDAAASYCRNLAVGDFRNWRLPSEWELHNIYDPKEEHHAKGGLQLSGSPSFPQVWTTTRESSEWTYQYFDFRSGGGGAQGVGSTHFYTFRALCVRP